MFRKKSIYLSSVVLVLLLVPAFSFGRDDSGLPELEFLLKELDRRIDNESRYEANKEERLAFLKEKVSSVPSAENRYILLLELSKEYEVYQCDSAILYARKSLETALPTRNRANIQASEIQLALCLAKAGMFDDTRSLLCSIDEASLSAENRIPYYGAWIDCLVYMMEYRGGYDIGDLIAEKCIWQDKLLAGAGETVSYDIVRILALRFLETSKPEEAISILKSFMENVPEDSREMASLTSLMSDAYRQIGDDSVQRKYLALSAIADVTSSVRETLSLRVLASLLFEDGDLERANKYIHKSLADANFFNARLRNLQNAQAIRIIDDTYQLEHEAQARRRMLLLGLSGLLSVLLAIIIIYVLKQASDVRRSNREVEIMNRRLSELNAALLESSEREKESNLQLVEANHLKELFMCNFLDICTDYIDKLRKFRRKINEKVRTGQTSSIARLVSNSSVPKQEKKVLYASFDKAFLQIYPSFIKEFNQLLCESERYPETDGMELNQELRIYALVKLGITNTSKIQTFLDYSPRTVYNYRSKVKSKAINQTEDFDKQVQSLCK